MLLRTAWLAGAIVIYTAQAPRAAGSPTIDQMVVEDLWRTYFLSHEPALFLIQKPTEYILSDGSSWTSGAGVGQQYTTRVSQQIISGNTIFYVTDRPVGALVFGWTDYDAGDHQAQGALAATAPLVLTAVVGSPTATLSGYAEIVSNDPTAWGEDDFNYYSAGVGDWAPFQLTYTLRDGMAWGPDTFDTQFHYDIRGVVDFAAAVPEPATVVGLGLGAALLCRRRRQTSSLHLRRLGNRQGVAPVP